MRSHGCGTLRAADSGAEVRLAGWAARRRDHGGVVFLDLRDASGVVQVVVHPDQAPEAAAAAHAVRLEDCLRVTGTVATRPAGNENPELPTGGDEVMATDLEVLSPSATPPFQIDDHGEVDEVLRLRYRYLDLRRPAAQRMLGLRAGATSAVRRVLEEHGFREIETPYLTRSTPEGARDFLVTTHLQPGEMYALPQSPQLFKQLLMVSGLERYYQIVRCFRDEALRADRQPEFTRVELPLPFPRLTYAVAMRRFGSDKPDLRYGMELIDLGEVFATTEVGVFASALSSRGSVLGLKVDGGGDLSRKQLDMLAEAAKSRGARGLAWVVVHADGLRSPLDRFFSDEERAGLRRVSGAQPGDLLLIAADSTAVARTVLGELRTRLAAERSLIPEGRWDFLWVTEFPMFEWNQDEERWEAAHHPSTQPSAKWVDTFAEVPEEATARAYDMVLNGVELGSGSIRIHRADMQRKVFEKLGIGQDEARERFGFFLRGLEYGAPPHGGFAFGLDRVVTLLAGVGSIREVIAFPKPQSGADPLTGAPAEVPDDQLAEVGLRRLPPPKPPGPPKPAAGSCPAPEIR